jgi:hypothetical protein
MALSDDQKALLRLLTQREQGYEDIAALKGKSVEEVRAEVRAALAELDAPPPEPPAPPPPPPPPAEPEPAPPASATPEREAKPAARPPARPRSSRPPVGAERRRLILLTGGGLAIVALVLGAVAIFSGGSDSGSSQASELATETAAAANGKVTQAVLTAADGGEASGRAVFGRIGRKEIVLQVTAENLEPTEEGESYTVWLYRTPKLTLRVGSVAVGDSGGLAARFPIPAELLAYVAGGAFDQVYISRTADAAYRAAVARAKQEKGLPRYTGETVLTGEITGPIAKK